MGAISQNMPSRTGGQGNQAGVGKPSKDHVKAKLREHVQGCAGCDVCQKWRHKFLKRSNAPKEQSAAAVPTDETKKKRKKTKIVPMGSLIRVSTASDELREQAQRWSLWDSTTFTFDEPQKQNKFHADYADVDEHRAVILTGKGTLTPDDGSAVLTISAGDSVVCKRGLKVTWHITEPMTKYFGYFDEAGKQVRTNTVGCDECGRDCWEQSWFLEDLDMDICPKCKKSALKAGKGDGEDMYKGAVMQRRGKTVKKKKKKTTQTEVIKSAKGEDEEGEEEEEEEEEAEEDAADEDAADEVSADEDSADEVSADEGDMM